VAQVEAGDREHYRLKAAQEAMQAAVQSGKSVGCTEEELESLFREVLRAVYSN
jgi:GntR family transcriptional regulator